MLECSSQVQPLLSGAMELYECDRRAIADPGLDHELTHGLKSLMDAESQDAVPVDDDTPQGPQVAITRAHGIRSLARDGFQLAQSFMLQPRVVLLIVTIEASHVIPARDRTNLTSDSHRNRPFE